MNVIILKNFEGYPDGGDKPSRHFAASDQAITVPDDFGAMIVEKGLARAAGEHKADGDHEAE